MLRLTFRLRAFLLHLACSFFIAVIALLVIYLLWHPSPLSDLQGVSRLVMILIGVDVVLGPIMTLILFSPQKARNLLLIDLGTVTFVQLAALAYGLAAIFFARPVFIVFNVDRFTIVSAAQIVPESLRKAAESEFSKLPLGRPRIVAARLPEDPVKRSDFLFTSLDSGKDIYQYPEYFVEYSSMPGKVLERARPIHELRSRNEIGDKEWGKLLEKFGLPAEDLAYLPVEGNTREGAAIIDQHTAALRGIVTLYPAWN